MPDSQLVVDRLHDRSAHPDSNLQHLRHYLIGYRDAVVGEEGNRYSPGGARHQSWEAGRLQALEDLKSA